MVAQGRTITSIHFPNIFTETTSPQQYSWTIFMSFQANAHSPSDTSESSNIEDTPESVPFKITIPSDCVASFVAKMYSSSNMTLMDVTKSVTCTQEVLERTVESLQHSTTTLLYNLQVLLDSESVQSLMSESENAKTMFKDVDTPFKMNKYFSEKFGLVKPKEIFLGHRADTGRKQGQVKQVLAAGHMSIYISR